MRCCLDTDCKYEDDSKSESRNSRSSRNSSTSFKTKIRQENTDVREEILVRAGILRGRAGISEPEILQKDWKSGPRPKARERKNKREQGRLSAQERCWPVLLAPPLASGTLAHLGACAPACRLQPAGASPLAALA